MDGPNPAPPKKPWDDSHRHTNWFQLHGSWVARNSFRPSTGAPGMCIPQLLWVFSRLDASMLQPHHKFVVEERPDKIQNPLQVPRDMRPNYATNNLVTDTRTVWTCVLLQVMFVGGFNVCVRVLQWHAASPPCDRPEAAVHAPGSPPLPRLPGDGPFKVGAESPPEAGAAVGSPLPAPARRRVGRDVGDRAIKPRSH